MSLSPGDVIFSGTGVGWVRKAALMDEIWTSKSIDSVGLLRNPILGREFA
jgi:2-keto-4-pentenoate hydratase/2-oxohepta-3-ene-1,7-dioic acid hydratase in catechol pathway